jgi:hypothetical protein
MKRYLCFACETDFSKPEVYKGITAVNGCEIKYTVNHCPFCHAEGDAIFDTVFIFDEIRRRVNPVYEKNEYLSDIVWQMQEKLRDVDLSKWQA